MAKDLREQLSDRKQLSAQQYDLLMAERKVNYGRMGWKTRFNAEDIRSNSYFLQEIKSRGERVYSRFSDIEKKSNNYTGGPTLHALSAAGHSNLRLAALEYQMLNAGLPKDSVPNFDKFYKKTIRERRMAVGWT